MSLVRRLETLRSEVQSGTSGITDSDLEEFRELMLHVARRGVPFRTLEAMLRMEAGAEREEIYRYEFLPQHSLERIEGLPARAFADKVLEDLWDAAREEGHYRSRRALDEGLVRKVMTVLFVWYAMTDPWFYGARWS